MKQGKNESVFLWLLEQDRQKKRANLLKEKNRDSEVHFPREQQNSPAIKEKVFEDKRMRLSPDDANELELLLKEKAELERDSRHLDQERKRLVLLVRMHLGQLAQEIGKRNNEKRQAIIQLREQIGKLETQLGGLSSS